MNNNEINLVIAQNECLKRQNQDLQKVLISNQYKTLEPLIREENEQLKTVYKAIETYGAKHQKIIAIEEMAELMKELVKSIRGESNRANIIEEIADVEIMMQQLSLIYNCTFEVIEMRRKKIERLKKRIENE